MSDVVVTVPKRRWKEWLEEGCCAGVIGGYYEYEFTVSKEPCIAPGERVYIVSHGRLRGYAPLVRVDRNLVRKGDGVRRVYGLIRGDGAVACTIPESIEGFRDFRYRWWDIEDEIPFPDWKTEGVK